jgi:MFS-type transporter involved in bile tolerance (Atg22 family)
VPTRKQKKKKKMKWHPWGTRRQLDPNFDDNGQVCLFHIIFLSYFAHFIFFSFHFNIDVLTCSCLFCYRMSKKSSLARSFHTKSMDGNKEGLFQGISSSSSRREVLIRAVQADFPRCGVAFMNEVI